ncbi:MAG: DMT family transporter [Desulfovibrio sp.]
MIQLLLGAVMISFSAVFVKLAHVSGDSAGFYRMFLGALGLLSVLAARAALDRGPVLPRGRDLWRLLAGAALCGVFFALDIACWHSAIHVLGPGLATIIGNFQAVLVAAFAYFVQGERRGRRFYLAAPLALAGLWLMVGPQWNARGADYRFGVLLALSTAVFYTAYLLTLKRTLTPERVGRVDSMAVVFVISVSTALCMAALMLLRGESFAVPGTRDWLVLGAYGLFGQVLGWVLVSRGLALVGAAVAGLLLLLQPALSYLWDVLFFARPVSVLELSGAGVALLAIYLGATARSGAAPGQTSGQTPGQAETTEQRP